MTTTPAKSPPLERETTFLEAIHQQTKNDNGAKAVLKRALSNERRQPQNIYPLVLRHLTGIHARQQDLWIFVACLSVYYPQDFRTAQEQRNFGHSCQRLASASSSDGAERRFRTLLDTSLEDIQIPLAALVRLMKSKEIRIDYPRLIADLCQWEHPDQYIQDRWARAFWGVSDVQQS